MSLPSAQKEVPAFVRALNNVMVAVHRSQAACENIVTEAVDRALTSVARDYGLDPKELRARYVDDIVQHFCTMGPPQATCAAPVPRKGGQRCTKVAVVGSYCRSHIKLAEAERLQLEAAERARNATAHGRAPPGATMASLMREIIPMEDDP